MLSIVGVADAQSVHTHKWANFFANRGDRVHIVSYGEVPLVHPQGLDPRATVAGWTLPGLHIKRFWITLGAIHRFRATVRRQQANLIHAHFLGAGAWYAALSAAHPLVVSVMGGGDVQGTDWRPRTRLEGLLTPFTLRRAALVTCWSRNLASIVRPMLRPRTRLEVLTGGVDTGKFRRRVDSASLRRSLGVGPRDLLILSPRLFWPLQNIDVIVRAMPAVLRAQPRARLLLVKYRASAHLDYESHVERLIDELGVRGAVRCVPTIANDDMPAYYSASDCTVSVPNTDGTPMTVMESLACGTPVIISDLSDYDSDLFVDGRTVLRVPVADPDGLARGLLRLMGDTELREAIVRNGGRMVAERGAYTVEMQRLEAMYHSVITGHS